MTALTIVALTAVVFMAFGALIGAQLQDHVHESRRRRMSMRQREINARFRAMQRSGDVIELGLPGGHYVMPVAIAERQAA